MAIASFNRIAVPNSYHEHTAEFKPYETVEVSMFIPKNSSWKVCYQTIWTHTKDYSDYWYFSLQRNKEAIEEVLHNSLLMFPFGKKLLWLCDFDMKCYELKNNKGNFVNIRYNENGILIPGMEVSIKLRSNFC